MWGIIEQRWGDQDASSRVIAMTGDASLRDQWLEGEFSLDWKERGNKKRPNRERFAALVVEIQWQEWADDIPVKKLIAQGLLPVGRNRWFIPEVQPNCYTADVTEGTFDAVKAALGMDVDIIRMVSIFGFWRTGETLKKELKNAQAH